MKPNLLGRLLALVAVSMLAAPVALKAQTTIFQDNFSSGSTINPTSQVVPTANSTAYVIAATKTSTGTGLSASKLTLGLTPTTSGYVEAQAQFTSSPVTLSSSGQYIQIYTTFTDTVNLFNGNSTNGTNVTTGLYNSGGVALTDGAGLANSGLSTTQSSLTTGDAAGWTGYNGQILYSASSLQTSSLYARPAQTGTDNFVQELGYAGGSTVGTTGGTNMGGTADTVFPDPVLTANSQYTVSLQIIYASPTSNYLVETLLGGAGLGGPVLYSSALFTGTNPIVDTFDGMEIGYRATESPSTGTTLGFTNVTVLTGTTNVPAGVVPEPSAFGMLGLAFAGAGLIWRRKRNAD